MEQLVLQSLQRVVAYAQEDKDEFVRCIMENKMGLSGVYDSGQILYGLFQL